LDEQKNREQNRTSRKPNKYRITNTKQQNRIKNNEPAIVDGAKFDEVAHEQG
jgi:hypothetical protein